MKKIIGLSLFVLLLGTMIACSNDKEDTTEVEVEDEVIHALEVVLAVTEEVDPDELVSMAATVTMGDEKVADADKVVFEVWEEGKKDDSEMIDSINEKDGTYTAETSFDADGLFHIQVHVDARGQHTMPLKAVTVGNGGEYEEAEEGVDEGEGHDRHAEAFSMEFVKPEAVQSAKETELQVLIELEGKALENAKVRYEIWNMNEDTKHDWVDTIEAKPGDYIAQHVFEEAGTYHVEIHVEDDGDLHEHEGHEIIVE